MSENFAKRFVDLRGFGLAAKPVTRETPAPSRSVAPAAKAPTGTGLDRTGSGLWRFVGYNKLAAF